MCGIVYLFSYCFLFLDRSLFPKKRLRGVFFFDCFKSNRFSFTFFGLEKNAVEWVIDLWRSMYDSHIYLLQDNFFSFVSVMFFYWQEVVTIDCCC